jgi:transposase
MASCFARSSTPARVHHENSMARRHSVQVLELALVEPLIPPARHGGPRRSVNVREALNGFSTSYRPVVSGRRCRTTCPPNSTVHDYLELWNWDGQLERIHHALYVAVREQEGRDHSTIAVALTG